MADKFIGIRTIGELEKKYGGALNRLVASLLVVPTCFFLMISLSVVESRLQTVRAHEKTINDFKSQIENLRKVSVQDEAIRKEIGDYEFALNKLESEQASLAMQSLWGSAEARQVNDGDWGNIFQRYSSDNNLMIASAASATLACLLAVILNGFGNSIWACGAGVAIGLFAMIAAKGAKAFLVAGAAGQTTDLDPYSIVFLAFLAGAYQHRLLAFLESLVQRNANRLLSQVNLVGQSSQRRRR